MTTPPDARATAPAPDLGSLIESAVERLPPGRQVLFLVKLVMGLAALVGDRGKVARAVEQARREAEG